MKKKAKKETLKANTPKIPIDILFEECNNLIIKEIAVDFHEEAKEILRLSSDEIRRNFLNNHKANKIDVCCTILDNAKRDLIASGKLKHKVEDAFGKPFML